MDSFSATVTGGVDAAVAPVSKALARAGSGVLTEIDVKPTFKNKLDIDRSPYRIMEACNPELARKALEADLDLGLIVLRNVVVREEVNGSTTVAFVVRHAMLGIVGNDAIEPVAAEVRAPRAGTRRPRYRSAAGRSGPNDGGEAAIPASRPGLRPTRPPGWGNMQGRS